MLRFAIAAPLFLALAVTAPIWAAGKGASTHGAPPVPAATLAGTNGPATSTQAAPVITQGKTASTDDTAWVPNVVDPKQWMDVQNLLSRVSSVVGRFKSDAKMAALMQQARGIFIVPAFGHGNSPSTGPWGSAVLMANNNGHWSNAVFFTLGGGSLGPHVIANGGSLILFIMNDRAMAKFENASPWSLTSPPAANLTPAPTSTSGVNSPPVPNSTPATNSVPGTNSTATINPAPAANPAVRTNPAPGTNIVNYSAATPQDLSGHGADIVAWSASGGPNSDTAVSVTDIAANAAWNGTVYGTPDLRNILTNRVPYINQDVINLRREMPSTTSAANSTTQNRPSKHA